MERCRKDSQRYSRIDEGRWNDQEKIHSVIHESTKVDGKMKKCSTFVFKNSRSLMERYWKNPERYSIIDEGKWKVSEKNFDDIQGSLKDNQEMMIRFKSYCKDCRNKMERWLNVSLRFWNIDEGKWEDHWKMFSVYKDRRKMM